MCPLPPVPFAQMCIQRKTLNKFIRDLSRGDDNPIPPDYPSRTAPSTKDAPIAPNPAGAVGLKRNKSRRARSTSSRSMPNTANPAAGASASASLSSALAHTTHAPPPDQVWGRKPELVRDKVREEAERAAASRGGRVRMPSKRAREASGQEPDEEAPQLMSSKQRIEQQQKAQCLRKQRKEYIDASFPPGVVLGVCATGRGAGGSGGAAQGAETNREWERVSSGVLSSRRTPKY